LETGNDSLSFKASSAVAAQKNKEDNHLSTKALNPKHDLKVAHFLMENPAHFPVKMYS
jgi:hypothetical protein